MPKDYISIVIKKKVWNRDCHISDHRIAQCRSCYCIVKIPQSLNHLIEDNDILPYECNGVAEFGHITSEYNRGKISLDNLIIQCKKCNTSLGTKEAKFDAISQDQLMIPSELLESNNNNNLNFMRVECSSCCYILNNGNQCKNKPVYNRSVCHIHLKY